MNIEHAFKPYIYSLRPFIGGGAYDPPPSEYAWCANKMYV